MDRFSSGVWLGLPHQKAPSGPYISVSHVDVPCELDVDEMSKASVHDALG